MRHTIVGQRREDRARRTIAAGAATSLTPVVSIAATAGAGWSVEGTVVAALATSLVAAALVSLQLLRVTRRMARDQRRFDDERRHWRDEANTDPLCRIPNRRGAYDQVERFRETAVPGASWTVLALDIDRFKAVNDTHGHAVGDRVLASVAASLRDHLPDGAAVARWGGDEFVVYLLGERNQSDDWARALADAVRAKPVKSREGDLYVGISYGLATGPSCNRFDDVLAVADDALLRAKASMRDQRSPGRASSSPSTTTTGSTPAAIELVDQPEVVTVASRPRPTPVMAPTVA